MLIPVERTSSELLSVVVALENTNAASTSATYVPVVSVKYSLPPRLGISATCRLPPRLVWASRRRGICQPPRPQLVMGPTRNPVYRLHGCGTHSLSDTLAVSQVTCQEMRQQIQGMNIHSTQAVRRFQSVSSSTPTVPLSQRVYSSGDGAGSSPHPGSSQEAAVGAEVGGWDCRSSDLQKLKELDLHGNSARPLSRSGANNRKEKVSVSYDHIQEELRPLGCGGAGGSSKQSLTLPPNGLRNHVLRTEHFLPQRSPHGPPSGQEEDPIAMGSLWSPNHQQLHTRGSSTVTTTTTTTAINSTASKTLPASVGNGNGSSVGSFISIAGSLPTRRPAPSAASTSLTLHHSSSAPAPTMGNIVKSKDKEVEPKYSDPVPGAPASFQQRLMELAALEAETVRWERSKKVKKKPLKQDKES